MNEKNRIHNPRKKVIRCIGNKVQDEKKCVESLQKQTVGVTFNLQNSQIVTFSSAIERIFLGTQTKSFCDKSFNFWFSFSAARYVIVKATEYITFGFSFCILVSFPC